MHRITSGDAQISFEIIGNGPPVFLLHPFPAHREFWKPAASSLSRYCLILPDLRGHGESEVGDGPATMEKHATDLDRLLAEISLPRAAFVGVSIGGYLLFEFWRRFRERVAALVLCNTKAQADTAEARSARLQCAADVLERGTQPFFESMLPKLLGPTTRETRPDLVQGARNMMGKMSPEGVAQVQRGMAERPDSVPTLQTINVPTLVLTGSEDSLTGSAEAIVMQQNISSSQMRVVPRAGHFAAWEQPEQTGAILRRFLENLPLG
jgi:3-oxoadipate enol-lactonase